ncbi:MAG TPA: histidine phosphatase family protein [Solirubrobacterales bacterium]|jgi:broad specificity phosphatase PhoE|nr:histidine phosphatase family protein [Solirubrobacterales bacterium]
MRVLFLRHGESAHNVHTGEERLGEELGDLLTEHGRAQAEAAGAGLRGLALGITRLYTSPMRRATETAEAIGAALGLEPEPIPYAFEYHRGEDFAEGMERVHLLKAHFEAESETAAAGGLPLLVTHGILTRFFLLDSILGDSFTEDLKTRMWHLRSSNCGLTTFEHGEMAEPGGAPVIAGWNCVTWMERPWDRP